VSAAFPAMRFSLGLNETAAFAPED